MLDILYNIFLTVIHSVETIISIILAIPTYLNIIVNLLGSLPTYIEVPIITAALASTVIAIKRLVF